MPPRISVRAGMSREKALYGLTMANAIILELQDRVGSLEAGKDADFIVLSGDPLSVYTKVLETWIEGSKVFDRAQFRKTSYTQSEATEQVMIPRLPSEVEEY